MKIWTSEHTFQHPWETVAKAAWQKYPNPLNPSVTGIDVVDRHVDQNGILQTKRVLSTSWGLPAWVTSLVGMDKDCYAYEKSEVDPKKKTLTLKTKNLTFCNFLTIDEFLIYSPHPEDKTRTHLKQEAIVKVKGVPLSSYMEARVTDTISKNANKGRQAMEWVIDHLKNECKDLRLEAQKCMDKMVAQGASKATS
ncbi:hypothetical protein SNE40_017726 [Patella caerulea]|uniref:PRELI/MSF1 domain-containing protein n=1 Tax=Patella caerulea TaxID=87958 RepID=A0AAN8PQC5_PATCE